MLEVLNALGKYPVAREALKIWVRLDIVSGGRFFANCQVMPEGPGARRGVRTSSLETPSSSTGVVRKFRLSSLVVCTVSCGFVLSGFRNVCVVMSFM